MTQSPLKTPSTSLTGARGERVGAEVAGRPAVAAVQRPQPSDLELCNQLIANHNNRVSAVRSLRAYAKFTFHWRDEDDRPRFETGDSTIVVVPPSNAALTVEKVTKRTGWIGCNSEQFWCIYLDDVLKAWIIRHDNVGSPLADDRLRIAGDAAMYLTGLLPFDIVTESSNVERVKLDVVTCLRATWRIRNGAGYALLRAYFFLNLDHPPYIVELVDPEEHNVIIRFIHTGNSAGHGNWLISSDLQEIGGIVEFHQVEMNVEVRPQIFDFAEIARSMRPEHVEVLDSRCRFPAIAD